MADAGKYGSIRPGDRTEGSEIGPEEPVFIIRAQDALAVQAIVAYHELAERAGCDDDFINGLWGVRAGFAKWQRIHGIKMPD